MAQPGVLTGVRDVGERCEAEGLGAAAELGPFPRTEEHCPVSYPAPEATAPNTGCSSKQLDLNKLLF